MIPGANELILTVVVIALLFGATKVPRVVKYSGKTFFEYKKGQREGEDGLRQIENRIKEMEEQDAGENSPDLIRSMNVKLNDVVNKAADKQTALLASGLLLIAVGAILVLGGEFLGEMTIILAISLCILGIVLAFASKNLDRS
ncbi:MAG: twin-arginine translocase TatA/TatE family subunit [Archaeoglobaceae archaeon]